ncbi:ComEA family DNA-binding protein [Planctomycetota bacterium]
MMQALKNNLGILNQTLFKPLQGNVLIVLVIALLTAGIMVKLYAGHTAPAMQIRARTVPRPEQPLNLNRASVEELCLLPGIGVVRARQIVKYRRHQGRFHAVDELKNIPGIGDKTIERLRPLLRISP